MIDVGHVGPRGPVAIGATADHLDLVIHPLERTAGDPDAGSGQHPVKMGPEPPRELLKGLPPVMGCPTEHSHR